MQRIAGGQRVGVCAIDPSSTHTRGSILGDKTRMTRLAAAEQAFVRPTPNAGAYGGVASRTREALVILEAAGFEVLFVETVGVGQSETRVADLVDVVVVLTLTGAGDALQGMKRGILEIADLLVIHKADGDNRPAALRLRAELKQTLHLFQPVRPGWEPRVAVASSIDGSGLGDVWEGIEDFLRTQKEAGAFHENREQQATRWLHDRIAEGLHRRALGRDDVQALIHRLEEAVRTGDVLPPAAAQDVLNVV